MKSQIKWMMNYNSQNYFCNLISKIVMFSFFVIILFFPLIVFGSPSKGIQFEDKSNSSGIDFVHYAPRPRWCEIGHQL